MLCRLSLSPWPSKFSSFSLVAVLRDGSPNRYSSPVWARQCQSHPGHGKGPTCEDLATELLDSSRGGKGSPANAPSPSPAIESIAVKRLKALCSIKEPTVNDGIDMVGAANLLKSTMKYPSRPEEIQRAKEQAEKAAMVLYDAESLRNEGVQLLCESQKLFEELL